MLKNIRQMVSYRSDYSSATPLSSEFTAPYRYCFRVMLGLVSLFFILQAKAQQTYKTSDPMQAFIQARQWFAEEQYQLAHPVFTSLLQQVSPANPNDAQLHRDELRFYILACELSEGMERAEGMAKAYLNANTPAVLQGQLRYYLGNYYFERELYNQALEAYSSASLAHLNNRQVGRMQFAQGYSYFVNKDFAAAKPMFNAVRQMPESPQHIDAHYYYGLIAFNDRNYRDALESFEVAAAHPVYGQLVPYYQASINYGTGKKDAALQAAEEALGKGNQFYQTELNLLVGHAYFEQGNFSKALPFLEQYVQKAASVKKQDLYELAYCYYQAGRNDEAISNFKPLAGGADSLSQHAMYLLGDLYLRKGDKSNARNAFLFCSSQGTNERFREIASFNYGKLSYELGYDAEALPVLQAFVGTYPQSVYQTEARDLLVSVLSNTSNYKEALEIYEGLKKPGLQSQKVYPKILFNRAQQQLSDRQANEAEVLLGKISSLPYNEPYGALAQFWLGELAFAKQNYGPAVEHFQEYLRSPVTAGEANERNGRYNLGYALMMVEGYERAREQFEKVLADPAIDNRMRTDATIRLADCLYMKKQFANATGKYQPVADGGGYLADYALYQLAMIAGAQNNAGKKVGLLNDVSRRYPSSGYIQVANMEAANTYLAQENFESALPFLDKVLQSNAAALKPEALLKQGLANYNIGRTEAALKSLESLIRQYPQSDEANAALETIQSVYVEEGRTADYLALMKKLGRNVDDAAADSLMFYAAELQWSDGKKDQAAKSFDNYLKQYPSGNHAARAAYQLGEYQKNDRKDVAAAVKYYDQVAALAPNAFAERSMLSAARIHYFELKDYKKAAAAYSLLQQYATSDNNRLEAIRGLVRSYYYGNDFSKAETSARQLLDMPAAASDDKVFASLVLGKQFLLANDCAAALPYFKKAASLSKAETGAEARYEYAHCLYTLNRLADAEQAAFDVVNQSGSYGLWVTKGYLLLGDIFLAQKDYFNAKATYQSVADNATVESLRKEAIEKLKRAEQAEAGQSKIGA